MSNLIRTANGKLIDMEQLRLANEKEIAVGNMGVNARGEVINKKKEVVVTRAQRLKNHYQLHSPVVSKDSYKKSSAEVVPTPRAVRNTVEETEVVQSPTPAKTQKPRGSLAAGFVDSSKKE